MEKLFLIKTKYDVKKVYFFLWRLYLNRFRKSKIRMTSIILCDIIAVSFSIYLLYNAIQYDIINYYILGYSFLIILLIPFLVSAILVKLKCNKLCNKNKDIITTTTEVYNEYILVYKNNTKNCIKIETNEILHFYVDKNIYFFADYKTSVFCDKCGFELGTKEEFEQFMFDKIKKNDAKY